MNPMEIYVNNKRIRLKPTQSIGKGGEADVYDLGTAKALKLFKQADHPDYMGLPTGLREREQQAAIDRLKTHQTKLPAFPKNLPDRVVKPESLVTDKSGNSIFGYTMPLLQGVAPLIKYSDRSFRSANGVVNQTVVAIFQDLYQTLAKIHTANVAIGDFNDLNILVFKDEAHLIDADSFQFGQFFCQMFTSRFVDPLLCDRHESRLVLQQAHNPNSDWYAFAIMLMECLLFVHPYGGVYKPKNIQAKIPHESRPLQRITIFHPEVQYPKPAIPYKVLSDDLLHYFYQCFEQDRRGEFPKALLDALRWIKCLKCGTEHARQSCPNCHSGSVRSIQTQAQPSQSIAQVSVGNVRVTHIFRTEGAILQTSVHNGELCWLYHDRGEFKREDGSITITGELDGQLQFRLQGKSTLIGKQQQMVTLNLDRPPQAITAERFDTNQSYCYWTHNGQLLRNGKLGSEYVGSEYIGDVLAGQTQFWVGSNFGFGFYRAGSLNVAFVFDAKRPGINDSVKLPPWQGELIDANCAFSADYCWFFAAVKERDRTIHYAYVIRANGESIASYSVDRDEVGWLSQFYGKCAVDRFLLAATDRGIVRMEPHKGQIIQTKEFPQTEPFVDASSRLFAAKDGIYVVKQNEILKLTII